MKTYQVEIWKIDAQGERNNDDAFLADEFHNAIDAGEWLYNSKNHPSIDCVGFELVVNGEVINTRVFGNAWEYPNDAECKAVDTI